MRPAAAASAASLVHELERLDVLLRFARQRLGPDVTVQRLLILICVAGHEGLSQGELLELLDATSITALSRNLADLSAFTSRKTPGPGLVEQRIDPANLRRRQIYLTPKGRRFFRDWHRAMKSPVPAHRKSEPGA